jgi:hypothetical protein
VNLNTTEQRRASAAKVEDEPLISRFGRLIIIAADGCWPWQGAISSNGYGIVWYRRWRAHRLVYEFFHGQIPTGLVIDHICRNRQCVNPGHLEVVTIAENNRRAARNPYATHCSRGHEFTPENTRLETRGYKRCRRCNREQTRLCRARRREALLSTASAE